MGNYKVDDMYCYVADFNKRTNNLIEEIESILKDGRTNYTNIKAKLFLNGMVNEPPINSIEDLDIIALCIDTKHNISISAHIHKDFIYTFTDIKFERLNICMGVRQQVI